MQIVFSLTLAIAFFCNLFATSSEFRAVPNASYKVTISNKQFMVDGKRIWFNGGNTPWDKWNDFGGSFNASFWDTHFALLHSVGVNCARVWINCNNDQGAVIIDINGLVTGVSASHFAHLDEFFEIAQKNKIYIMATLLSFDHFKNNNAQKWRNMCKNQTCCASFADKYVVPFVNRYKSNPFLFSIDLCNEPDWIFENDECGRLPWENISYLFARCAAVIHENSDVLVTVGMGFCKYNSDLSGCEGNKVSDAFLQKLYPDKNAYLDFWSPHYYDWVGEWYGVPFYLEPYGNRPPGWYLDSSKPAMIAECSARGSQGNTLQKDYESALQNGWQGVLAWTTNGVDSNGGFNEIQSTVRYMLSKYGDLVFPVQ